MSRDPWPGWEDEARDYAQEHGLSATQFDSILKESESRARSQAQLSVFIDGSTVTGFQVGRSCQLRLQVRNQGKRGLKSVGMDWRATCSAGQAEAGTRSIGPGRSSVLALTITPTLAGQHSFECILHASDYGQAITHFLIEGITFEVAPEEVSAATVINHTTVDFGDVRAADQSGMVIGGGGASQRDARLFIDGDWVEIPIRICGPDEVTSWFDEGHVQGAPVAETAATNPSPGASSSESDFRERGGEDEGAHKAMEVEGRLDGPINDAQVPPTLESRERSSRSSDDTASEADAHLEGSYENDDGGGDLPLEFEIVSIGGKQSEVVRLLCDEAGFTLLGAVRGVASLPLQVRVGSERKASPVLDKLRELGVEVALKSNVEADVPGPLVMPPESSAARSFGECTKCSKLGELVQAVCASCQEGQSFIGQRQSSSGSSAPRPALLIATTGRSRVELIHALAEVTSSPSGRIAEQLSVFPAEVPLACTEVEAQFAVTRLRRLGVDVRLLS